MAFIRTKTINGIEYKYLVRSRREGKKVIQEHIKYVGKNGEKLENGDLSKDYKNPESWHTNRERQLIYEFGGEVKKGYGFDGFINGYPVEVRSARKDYRFRIQKNVHNKLLSRSGYYIFDSPDYKPVLIKARDVDKMLSAGDWLQDRDYPHKFVTVDQIWRNNGSEI